MGLFKKGKSSQPGGSKQKNVQPNLGKTNVVKDSLYERVFTDKPVEKKADLKLVTKSVDYVYAKIPENSIELLADNALAGTLPGTSSLFSVYVDSSAEENFPPYVSVVSVMVPSYSDVYEKAHEFMNEVRIQRELEEQKQVEVARKEKENLIANMQYLDLKVTDPDNLEEEVEVEPKKTKKKTVISGQKSAMQKKSGKKMPKGKAGVDIGVGGGKSSPRKMKTVSVNQQEQQPLDQRGAKRKVVPKIYE